MTLPELIFYCATTENGKRDIEKCYEKGRADAIDEVIKLVEAENCAYFEWESEGLIDTLKKMKEQK